MRGRDPTQDLRAGHDRRHQAGDPVGLGVAIELEQVRLQRVEAVDADAAVNSAWTISHFTAGTRQPFSIDAEAMARISASGRAPRLGVKPMSRMNLNAPRR